MMKKLAVLAMMVFGSTSIASAGSYHSDRYESSRYERSPQSVDIRDHRSNRSSESWDAPPCNEQHVNVTGYYVGPAGNVNLVQRGNRIYGTFVNGGQMNGVIENGRITYTWTGAGYHGRGYWYVAGNGKLVGTWGANDSNSAGGNWNLTLA